MAVRYAGLVFTVAVFGLLLVLADCGERKELQSAPPAPAVTVTKVVTQDIRPALLFTGRVQAKDKVELRARIDGFLEKRLFVEGADVKIGDLLFTIEKGMYQAAVDEIKGTIEKARAALTLADIEVSRQTTLLARDVGAQARVDEAVAKQGQARGDLAQQKAALEKAELNLSYTDIRAPIDGRIGLSVFSVGNFVSPGSGVLATIVSQDPIYVTFPVTQREMLAVRKTQGLEKTTTDTIIYIQLADGSRYSEPGKPNFIDVTVNQGTDTVQVRATFANPNRILVDGQLVTVVAESGTAEPALLIPQAATQVDQAGIFVLVVDQANKVEVRRIETSIQHGAMVVVEKGLQADERIIVEGIQKVRPGQVVQATEIKPEG